MTVPRRARTTPARRREIQTGSLSQPAMVNYLIHRIPSTRYPIVLKVL